MQPDHGREIITAREDFSYENEAYEHIFYNVMLTVTLEEYIEYYVKYHYELKGKTCEGWFRRTIREHYKTGEYYYVLRDKKDHLGDPILNENGEEIHLPWPTKFADEELKIRVKNIIQISLILRYYQATHNEDDQVRRLKILIFTNYLLCWNYILIVSLVNFPTTLMKAQELIELFSQLWL